jgi:ribosomal protein S18 acetylase RimI-like enzyme
MKARDRWTVRQARLADVEPLLRLMAAFNRAERIPFRRARVAPGLRRLLRDRRLGLVLVAEAQAKAELGGYAIGTLGFDLEFGGPDAFLTEIFVARDQRRDGLGARLLEATARALRELGAAAVTLLVRPENVAARRLYSRAGFRELPRLAMVRRLARARSGSLGRS